MRRLRLEQLLVVCASWFPITCAYRWQGEMGEDPEVISNATTKNGFAEQSKRSSSSMSPRPISLTKSRQLMSINGLQAG